MVSKSVNEKLNDVFDRVFDQKTDMFSNKFTPPIDTRRSNIHDSKKEFSSEQQVVESVKSHLAGILEAFRMPLDGNPQEWQAMTIELHIAIEVNAITHRRAEKPQTASELALHNLTQTGFSLGSLKVISEMLQHYTERSEELKRQEVEFWSVKNRPPNYYARTIALRFAKYYAAKKRMKPTFGTSKDGGHPSTDFSRALEEIFDILQVKGNLTRAAKWAVDELKEEDWQPKNAFAGIYDFTTPNALALLSEPLGAIRPIAKNKGS